MGLFEKNSLMKIVESPWKEGEIRLEVDNVSISTSNHTFTHWLDVFYNHFLVLKVFVELGWGLDEGST